MRTSCSGGGSSGGVDTQWTNSSNGSRCSPMLIVTACQCCRRSLIADYPGRVGDVGSEQRASDRIST